MNGGRFAAATCRVIAVSGLLLLGVNYALTFWGAQYLPSALTSVLAGHVTGVRVRPRDRDRSRALFNRARLALPLGVVGVALVSRGQFAAGTLAGWGSAAVVGGAACAAVAYAIVKRRATHLPPTLMVATQTLCAAGAAVAGRGRSSTAIRCIITGRLRRLSRCSISASPARWSRSG